MLEGTVGSFKNLIIKSIYLQVIVWFNCQCTTLLTSVVTGLFSDSHMKYELERADDTITSEAGEPSLAEMTSKAIEILRRNKNGYVLLVEGILETQYQLFRC